MKSNEVYDLIFGENPSWKSIIYRLVREGKINPWDIDISVLTQEYLKTIRKMENFNFRISGKVILAAAILLKLKTNQLGLKEFISLTENESQEEEIYEIEFPEVSPEEEVTEDTTEKAKSKVDVKVPHERKRKITISELTKALKKAIEVEEKREERKEEDTKKLEKKREKMKKKRKGIDIFKKIKNVYKRVRVFIKDKKKENAELVDIVPTDKKKDIIWTFVPLLHLADSGKVKIEQKETFGPIWVSLENEKRKKKD